MIKKIITVILVIVSIWFFVDRSLNFAAVNRAKYDANNYQWRLNWMDRK